jgi:hemerythrin
MEKILWKDEYSVGVEEFDRHHKHLFEIINKLITPPFPLSNLDPATEALVEMYDFAREHFTAEEELMQQYGYPELREHKKQHEYFIGTTNELSSGKINADEIAEFLKVWWLIHILKVDMKYKDFFKAKLHAPALKS